MLRGRRRLYPFEVAALAMALVFGAVLVSQGLPLGARSLPRVFGLAVTLLVGGGVVGITLQCAAHALTGRGVGGYLAALREASWWLLWLRLWLACMLASYAYFWLKVYVPLLHGTGLDPQLWRLDRLLHVGVSPSSLAIGWLPAGPLTSALDLWYGVWLLTLAAGIAFFAASERAELRRAVMFSCITLWALGALCYLAFPVVGPAFAYPSFFRSLPAEMPIAAASQDLLWRHYHAVVQTGAVGDYTRGVAALPSLHVGFHALFALWGRHVGRPLFAVLLVLTGLTFVGSVRTGWHYAVDGYAGAALAVLVYVLARRFELAPGRGAPHRGDSP